MKDEENTADAAIEIDLMKQLAGAINAAFNGGKDDPETAFALLVFPFDAAERAHDYTNYVLTNAKRCDLINMMKEFILRVEARIREGGPVQ